MKNVLKYVLLSLIAVSPALAWPSCPGNWNQVANGTMASGSQGQVGEIYTADGITWQCQKTPTPPTAPSTLSQNQNQSQSQSSNSSSNSTATTNSNANSSSTSKGGNSASTATGGSSTATGGVSVLKNAGNSTMTNSGNSSNTNTNSATGGQGGAGGSANSSASNNSSGNSTSYESTSTYNEVRQNPGAYAPIAAFTTSPCSKGYSAGAGTPSVAATLGIVLIDKGCDSRQTALNFYAIGNPAAAAQVLCSTDASKRAHLTLKECLTLLPPVVIASPALPPAPVQPQVIVVPVPAPVATPAPAVPATLHPVITSLGVCNYTRLNCVNRLLDQGILSLQNDSAALIVLSGPVGNVAPAVKYLRSRNVDPSRMVLHLNDIDTVAIAVEVNQ